MVYSRDQQGDPISPVFARLLVAYDFSALSDIALEYALNMAQEHLAVIRIVHASGKTEPPRRAVANSASISQTEDGLDERLRKLVEKCRLRVRGTEFFVRSGTALQVLAKEVDNWEPDVVFLGAYGSGPTDREGLGSTVESLLRSLPCLVVAVGPKVVERQVGPGASEAIVCPIDFPQDVHGRLDILAEISNVLRARVKLVHVVDVCREFSRPHGATDIQFQFDSLVARLQRESVIAESTLLYGTPEIKIAEYAKEKRATYILFGLHKEGDCSSYFHTSLVAKVIKNAPCAIMIFPQYVEAASRILDGGISRRMSMRPANSMETSVVEASASYQYGY